MPREGHDDFEYDSVNYAKKISIHVPREGHDLNEAQIPGLVHGISIHVPREGHDKSCEHRDNRRNYFYPRAP